MRNIVTCILSLLVAAPAAQAQQLLAQAQPEGSKDWGYIDRKGGFAIEPQYTNCHAFSESGWAPIYDRKEKTFYFINSKNEKLDTEVKEFKLQNIFGFGTKSFENGIAPVEVNKDWGYLNAEGKLILAAEYDKAEPFGKHHGVVMKDKTFFIVDRKGGLTEVTLSGVEDLNRFSEGLAPVRVNGLWGLMNAQQEIVIEAKFRSIGYMSFGVAWVKTVNGDVGFIDKTGAWTVEPKYRAAKDMTADMLARVKNDNGWLYVNIRGAEKDLPDADTFGDFSNGLAYGKKDGKVGFFNKKGEWVVEPKYDAVRDFQNGLAAVRLNDKWGFIDKTGSLIIEHQFDNVKDFANAGQ